MSKFTPGPWRFRQLNCVDGRGMGYIEANGRDIAHTGDAALWTAENFANARLIAKAPEMCEALREVAQFAAREIDVPFEECIAGPIYKARKLLAEINGETS